MILDVGGHEAAKERFLKVYLLQLFVRVLDFYPTGVLSVEFEEPFFPRVFVEVKVRIVVYLLSDKFEVDVLLRDLFVMLHWQHLTSRGLYSRLPPFHPEDLII